MGYFNGYSIQKHSQHWEQLQVLSLDKHIEPKLSTTVRNIFFEIGLPDLSANAFKFYIREQKLKLCFMSEKELVLFGEYSGNYLAIETRTEHIFMILDHDETLVFANSNLESFLLFLVEYDAHYLSFYKGTSAPSEDAIEKSLSLMKGRMKDIDQDAFKFDTYFWPRMVFDMQYGLV